MRGIGNDSVAGDRGSAASMVARYEALIRVSEALRAYHDRDTLFRSLARELRPVVRFSFLGLGLYDEPIAQFGSARAGGHRQPAAGARAVA